MFRSQVILGGIKIHTKNGNDDVWENDIYSEEIIEDLVDDDIITSAEAGFMKGYMDAG